MPSVQKKKISDKKAVDSPADGGHSVEPEVVVQAVCPIITKSDNEIVYDPHINPKAVSLIQQPDGNWKGEMQRFGKVVEVRGIGPETVLQMLLTHE